MSLKTYLSVSPVLIPFLVGIIRYKSLREYKFLFYFVCLGVLSESLSVVFISLGAKNTMPKSHLYALAAHVLLCFFYKSAFHRYISGKWFSGLIALYIIISGIALLFFQSIYDYPSTSFAVLSISMVTLSIVYFYKVMLEAEIRSLSKEPMIWINTAILIYYAGNLFYNVLFNLFLDYSRSFLISIGSNFYILNTIFYVLIAIGFYLCTPGKKKRGKPAGKFIIR